MPHNLIELLDIANEKRDRRMSWACFQVETLPSSRMNILNHIGTNQLSRKMIFV